MGTIERLQNHYVTRINELPNDIEKVVDEANEQVDDDEAK